MNSIYHIKCRTHLHVGSGDNNYGVIDKMVQRDPTDKLPCIYSSSLKGAIREYFEVAHSDQVESIFGNETKSSVVFHQAHLLSIPVRSNAIPYFNVTCPQIIDDFIDRVEFLEVGNVEMVNALNQLKAKMQKKKIVHFEADLMGSVSIEDYRNSAVVKDTLSESKLLESVMGSHIAIVDNGDFIRMTDNYNLPIIARNKLENGESQNLWYEQIVPRESRFYFATTTTPGHEAQAEQFYDRIGKRNKIQIGANATIGYGLCELNKL